MRQKDFYEIKDENGNYILRNSIEDIYSGIEGDIKPDIQEFIDLFTHNDFQDKFIEIIQNKRWGTIEASLLLYLIITIIRSKGVKDLIYSKSNLKDNEKHILYLLITTSRVKTVEYAKKMYLGQELEEMLLFIRHAPEGSLKVLTEHIMNNYQIRVHKTLGNKKYFLSDNPVIIQKFEGEDYHLPITPEICIGLIPIKLKGNEIMIDQTIHLMSDENVDRINEQLVMNANMLLIISNEDDLEFTSNIISRTDIG